LARITNRNLTIYDIDGRRCIASDDADGRSLASQVLGGRRADDEAAQPTGLSVDELSKEQQRRLSLHGWCFCED